MAVVNDEKSKRGTLTDEDMRIRNPETPLTPAQRRKASMNRRAKEEKDSGRISTPAGVAGAMLALTPFGMAKAFLFPAKVGKSLISKGLAKASSKAASKNATKAPNALVQKMQNQVAAAAKMGKPKPNPKVKKVKDIAKVATGKTKPGPRGTSVTKNKSNQVTGNISGQSTRIGKGVRDMAGPAARAAGVVAASAAAGSPSQDNPLSKLPIRTVAKRREPVPVDDTPRPDRKPTPPKERPVQGRTDKPLKALEGGVRYIDNPFGKGKIKVDSSDAAFDMEPEFSGDYKGGRPGMKKNVARRNAGGTVGRGMGKALRGGGKVMK
jgi:hypothetical protein